MTFEKDFPGVMKDIETEPVAYAMHRLGVEKHMKMFLKKYCLDKQKVKKAWKKFVKNVNLGDENLVQQMVIFEKDLGMK